MTPEHVLRYTIPAALALLPARMDTPEARAMLLAIGLQESRFQHRRQVGGPARGFWQFEAIGVGGVLDHEASRDGARSVSRALDYSPTSMAVYPALADNDILACAFARLLLWTLPGSLAVRTAPELGWSDYLNAWRPGKPHRETWAGHWSTAWDLVEGTGS